MRIARTIRTAIVARLVDMLPRAVAVVMVSVLFCAPLAAFAAVAGAPAMLSDMAMSSASAPAGEMPCHQDKSDAGKNCPFMAICVALCCQGVGPSEPILAAPEFCVFRIAPPALVRLDGIKFPPPSRPPKT